MEARNDDPQQEAPAPSEEPNRPRVRFHVPGGRFGVAVLVLALLWLANSISVRLTSKPLEAVRRIAEEQRPGAELVLLAGGYESGLLGMTAEGTFRVDGPDGPHELELVVTRSTAFMDWRIVRMRDQPYGG